MSEALRSGVQRFHDFLGQLPDCSDERGTLFDWMPSVMDARCDWMPLPLHATLHTDEIFNLRNSDNLSGNQVVSV